MKVESWCRTLMRWIGGTIVLIVPIAAGACLSPSATASSSTVSFRALASAFEAPAKVAKNVEVSKASNLEDWTYTRVDYGALAIYQGHEILAFYREEAAENQVFNQSIRDELLAFMMLPHTAADVRAEEANINSEKRTFNQEQAAEVRAFNAALAQQRKTFIATGILSPIFPHDMDDVPGVPGT